MAAGCEDDNSRDRRGDDQAPLAQDERTQEDEDDISEDSRDEDDEHASVGSTGRVSQARSPWMEWPIDVMGIL